jgi:transcriptional regulator with XRE-family HTH domain
MVRLYLREWREQRGLTMHDLSKRTEIPVTTLSKIEGGDMVWNAEHLAVFADALDCAPPMLLSAPE